MSQEDLATRDELAPILECNSTECDVWAIATVRQWLLF